MIRKPLKKNNPDYLKDNPDYYTTSITLLLFQNNAAYV